MTSGLRSVAERLERLRTEFTRRFDYMRSNRVIGAVLNELRGTRITWWVLAVGGAFLVAGWWLGDAAMLACATWLLYAACVVRSVRTIRESYVLLAVLLAFGTFLLSRSLTSRVFDYPRGSFERFGMPFTDPAVDVHVFTALSVALAGLYLSAPLFGWAQSRYGTIRVKLDHDGGRVIYARRISLLMFWCVLPFHLAGSIEAAAFVARNGYLSYYADFHTAFPEPLRLVAGSLTVAFLSYLATNPAMRKTLLPIAAYLASGVLSLGTGQRTEFVLSVTVVLVYVGFRHFREQGSSSLITTKMKITAIVLAPVGLIGSGVVARLRTTYGPQGSGPLVTILDPLYAQGVSADVVGYGYVYQDQVDQGRLFSLGPLVDFLTRHVPGVFGLGSGDFAGQTAERATNSGYFSHAISYLVLRDDYFRGYGLGSSYVAELWADFSYAGVFVGSVVIGLVVLLLTRGLHARWWLRLPALLLIREIVMIPRQSPTQFIVEAATFSTVAGGAVIVVATLVAHRYSRMGPRGSRLDH